MAAATEEVVAKQVEQCEDATPSESQNSAISALEKKIIRQVEVRVG